MHFSTLVADLAQFEFIMIHKKGIENVNLNAMSRSDHLDELMKRENKKYQTGNEVGELKITYATDLEADPVEIAKERQRFAGYSLLQCTARVKKQNMRSWKGNREIELRKLQKANKFLKEVSQWVAEGKAPHMQGLRVKVQDRSSILCCL